MATFFIPKRINVGFRERGDTYTGKLAYIVYFDEKGKLRKETSWNGWRDKKIENEIHDNEPTSGFVLNKKAGGYSTGWNHRQTYVRVYDPRGFEFEITVPNLLYILENATSTKGKGLEGNFVYGWDGKDLVLIPCDAPDYQELVKLNELRHSAKKIGARDLKIGATYRTKDNQEWIYMGRFDEYSSWKGKSKTKSHFFASRGETYTNFHTLKSTTQKLVEEISGEPVEDFAEMFDQLERKTIYSPYDESKDVFVPYPIEELRDSIHNTWRWNYATFLSDYQNNNVMRKTEIYYDKATNRYAYLTYKKEKYAYGYGWNKTENIREVEVKNYVPTLEEAYEIVKPMKRQMYLENGKLYQESVY